MNKIKKYFNLSTLLTFLLLIIINFIFIFTIYSLKTSSNYENEFNILIVGNNKNDDLESLFISVNEKNHIKKLNFHYVDINNQYYDVLIQTKGFLLSEFLIIPKSLFNNIHKEETYLPINSNLIKDIDSLIKDDQNNIYGIPVHIQNYNPLKKYVLFDDDLDMYLFINKNSYHVNRSLVNNDFELIDDYLNVIIKILVE